MLNRARDVLASALVQHPLSAAFPAMADDAFQALVDSVSAVGVQNPIVLFDGAVIDGWHRYRAARVAGVACPAVDLAPDTDPRDFVIAQNERRRHLTSSQIAAAVVRVYEWQPPGRPNGEKKAEPGSTLSQEEGGTGFHLSPKSNAELAGIAGVSDRMIRQAKEVQTHAVPAVQAAVQAGDVSLKAAAVVAKLPAKEQRKIAKAGPAAIKEAAKHEKVEAPEEGTPPPMSELDELRDRYDEMAALLKTAVADNESMARVFDANDQVASAMAEAKRFRDLNTVLESRIAGLMNEKNEAVRLLKHWKRRAEKAEAALAEKGAGQ